MRLELFTYRIGKTCRICQKFAFETDIEISNDQFSALGCLLKFDEQPQ
jgi:hypothetical protein